MIIKLIPEVKSAALPPWALTSFPAMTSGPGIRGLYNTDLVTRARYSEGAGIYRIVPEAVALPADEADLISLVRWAARHRVPLTPRGAGSSVTGSNVSAGVIVDLTRMPRIIEISPATRRARTSANIRWAELNETAGKDGLRLPPDPSSGAFATLGGMVSTNASGSHSLRYGSMRRWVLAITVITADGKRVELKRGSEELSLHYPRQQLQAHAELIRARFPKTTKNSSGYALDAWLASGDTLDLFIGAEGTLGIVTEIEWRLDPIPLHRAGLNVQLDDLDRLTGAVETTLAFSPSALELLDRTFLDLVESGAVDRPPGRPSGRPSESVLLVEFEGNDAAELKDLVHRAVRALQGIASSIETALTPAEEASAWRLRHAASPIIADLPAGRRSLQVIEDACLPLSRMGEYITAVRTLAQRVGVPIVIFGHAGDGNIHVNLLPDTTETGWENAVGTLYRDITGEVIRLGGTTSGEHGDGRIRSSVLERLYGPDIVRLFHAVKDAFDPLGILNPGVKVAKTVQDPLTELKVGAAAAAIPADIVEELREIERTGDYRRERI
jgi:FAD/FMN-containing dehydrogenase